jgi:hypothetical protein
MGKSRKIERKVICNVLLKNSDEYFLLASVEGEKKEEDPSVYFVVQSGNESRENAFQYSYHHFQTNELVQTHVKGMQDKSKRFQKPLSRRNKAILSVHLNDFNKNSAPRTTRSEKDIVLSIKHEFVKFCNFLFYTTEKSLFDYACLHDEVVLHKYDLPTSYSKVGFAVLMQKEKLQEIQFKPPKGDTRK